jgi:hypothetical protein
MNALEFNAHIRLNCCAKELISEQWASAEGSEMAEKVAEDSCTYVQQVMDVLYRVEQDQKDLDEGKHEEEKNSF